MARCSFCDHILDSNGAAHDRDERLCAVCTVRTTRQARWAYRQGRRLDYCYMDSD